MHVRIVCVYRTCIRDRSTLSRKEAATFFTCSKYVRSPFFLRTYFHVRTPVDPCGTDSPGLFPSAGEDRQGVEVARARGFPTRIGGGWAGKRSDTTCCVNDVVFSTFPAAVDRDVGRDAGGRRCVFCSDSHLLYPTRQSTAFGKRARITWGGWRHAIVIYFRKERDIYLGTRREAFHHPHGYDYIRLFLVPVPATATIPLATSPPPCTRPPQARRTKHTQQTTEQPGL